MNKYLESILKNNPHIEIKSKEKNWEILTPWNGDNSVSLSLKKKSTKHKYLEHIVFPQEFAGIYNIKNSCLEFTYGAARKNSKIIKRKFEFVFRGEIFKCGFKDISKSLEYIIESFNEEQIDGPTDYRNLSSVKKYLSLSKMHKEVVVKSFFIEGNFKKIDFNFISLAKSLNFYMQLFHRDSPYILVYKKDEQNEQFKDDCEYKGKHTFPSKINSANIDPTLLDTFLIAHQTNNVRLKFIFYYQVLEFCSYYYLDNKIQSQISGILKNPKRYDDPEYFSKAIIESMKDHFGQKNDSANLKKTINENININEITEVLEINASYFCRDIVFDGGLKIPKIHSDSKSIKNLVHTDLVKIKENIEKIRNVLVHLRETRENKVILPTEKNNNLLLPYLFLLRKIAELVAIKSSSN